MISWSSRENDLCASTSLDLSISKRKSFLLSLSEKAIVIQTFIPNH
jgi:hypothetical protein